MEISEIRTAYEICKVLRRDPITGKAYTDRDFANDYLDSSFSMVTKVFSGKAVSKPTTDAMIQFIRDTYPGLKAAINEIDKLAKSS